MANRIDLRLGPAAETLRALLSDEGAGGSFDFGFIDANKAQYDEYYELVLALLRPGGVLCIDNTLWKGAVLHQEKPDAQTRAIQSLNEKVYADVDRVSELCMLPTADGITIVRKRSHAS